MIAPFFMAKNIYVEFSVFEVEWGKTINIQRNSPRTLRKKSEKDEYYCTKNSTI